MILDTHVLVSAGGRNSKYYENLGYIASKYKNKNGVYCVARDCKILIKIEHLQPSSIARISYQCDVCGITNTIGYKDLIKRASIKTLCVKCCKITHGCEYYSQYKNNAKRRKLKFDLSIEQFKILTTNPKCHYCGGCSCDYYAQSKNINGIDRIDSSNGYFFNNCVTCCSTCNKMKLALGYDDFISHIRKIYEHTKD